MGEKRKMDSGSEEGRENLSPRDKIALTLDAIRPPKSPFDIPSAAVERRELKNTATLLFSVSALVLATKSKFASQRTTLIGLRERRGV